jgi:hypothetical protein
VINVYFEADIEYWLSQMKYERRPFNLHGNACQGLGHLSSVKCHKDTRFSLGFVAFSL